MSPVLRCMGSLLGFLHASDKVGVDLDQATNELVREQSCNPPEPPTRFATYAD